MKVHVKLKIYISDLFFFNFYTTLNTRSSEIFIKLLSIKFYCNYLKHAYLYYHFFLLSCNLLNFNVLKGELNFSSI